MSSKDKSKKFIQFLQNSMSIYDLSESEVPSLGGDLGEAFKNRNAHLTNLIII
jgi:hypothetical protein